MNRLRRSLWRFELLVLVVALQGVLLGGSNVAPSQGAPVPEAKFASVTEPIGAAASPFQLLVTHPLCETEGLSREVLLINSDGSTSTFATLPSRDGCGQDHIATATPFPNTPFTNTGEGGPPFPTQNPAGFTSNDKFVTQGDTVYRIPYNATIPHTVTGDDFFAAADTGCPLSSPTFDTAGTWGGGTVGKLIVVVSPCGGDSPGSVVVFNHDGTTASTTTLDSATVGTDVEGAAVAPSAFGAFAGHLLIAAGNVSGGCDGCPPGKVFAVCPPSTATESCPNGKRINAVASVPFAEDVRIVPTTRCSYGTTNGATYFTDIFGGTPATFTVDQLPLGAFTGEDGNALIPSENTTGAANAPGITRLTPGLATSTFRGFFLPHEASTFTDCTIPVLAKTTLNAGGGGGFVPRFVPPLLAWIPGRSLTGDAAFVSPLLAQAKYFTVTWFPDPNPCTPPHCNFDPALIRTRTVRLFINGKQIRPAFCRGTREDDNNPNHPPQPVTCFFRFEDAGSPTPTSSSKYKIVAIYRDSGGGNDPECEGGGG